MAKGMNDRGVALITALIAMVVLALLVVGITNMTIAGSQLSVTNRDHSEALYVAESGIVRVMNDLPTNWHTPDNITRNGLTNDGAYHLEDISFLDESGNPTTPSPATSVVAITSIGRVLSDTASDRATRRVKVWVKPNWPQYFGYGLAALSDGLGNGNAPLTLKGGPGCIIDGYHSSLGPYDSQTTQTDTLTGMEIVEGGVGIFSNGSAKITTSATVFGSLTCQTPGVLNGDPGNFVEGGVNSTADGIEVKDWDTALYSDNNNNSEIIPANAVSNNKALSVSKGSTVILPGGIKDDPKIYYFSSMTVKGTLQIGSVSTQAGDIAPVIIYVEGNINVQTEGSLANKTEIPTNMLIFCTGDVTLAGNGEFYGGLYAPYGEVKITGNSDFYGAIVGREIQITSNISFHYDKDLANVKPGDPTGFSMWRWQELSPP